MDLMDFVPSTDNVVVELKIKDTNLKNADGSNMTITVMSPFSKEYKKVLYEASEKRLELKDPKPQDFEALQLEQMVNSTIDWNITWGGEKPKFSKELALEIYDKGFWIRPQIMEAQAALADFTIPSQTN